jgi:hypothetical protein
MRLPKRHEKSRVGSAFSLLPSWEKWRDLMMTTMIHPPDPPAITARLDGSHAHRSNTTVAIRRNRRPIRSAVVQSRMGTDVREVDRTWSTDTKLRKHRGPHASTGQAGGTQVVGDHEREGERDNFFWKGVIHICLRESEKKKTQK